MAPADVKYEEALKRLEKLVADLDRPDADLETRLKKFEEGTKLARILLQKLEQAKKRVEKLVKTAGGDALLVPIDDDTLEDQGDLQSPNA